MKKLIVFATVFAVLVAGVALSVSANAASPRPNRNDVVVVAPGGYTYNAGWHPGNSQDGGPKGQSITLGDGSTDTSSFAYYAFTGWWDQYLTDVSKIRASFKPAAGTVNSGGSPRISLEVGEYDGDVTVATGDVIYLDPAQCSDPAGNGWSFANFTDDLTNCSIFDSRGTQYTSDGVTSAWDMLVADPYYDGATVWFAYAIQDASTGPNYVDRIMLDSAFLTKQP